MKIKISKQPLAYLNSLLCTDLDEILKNFPATSKKIEQRLLANHKLFESKIIELDIKPKNKTEIYQTLFTKLKTMEKEIAATIKITPPYTLVNLRTLLEHVLAVCPSDLKRGFFIKEKAASAIFKKCPPVNLLRHYNCSSITELFTRINVLDAVALSRHSESQTWQEEYLSCLANAQITDFELRDIRLLLIDENEHQNLFQKSNAARKPWKMSHSKEAGIITCFANEGLPNFIVPLLQYALLAIHYFFEIAYTSKFYRQIAANQPKLIGQAIVKSIIIGRDKFPFFHPNLYSENLFWKKAVAQFQKIFSLPSMSFFGDVLSCGENIASSASDIISLNLIDLIWNINFNNSIKSDGYFSNRVAFFLYHFRGALWQEIFRDLLEMTESAMDETIIAHLDWGDLTFTKEIIANNLYD